MMDNMQTEAQPTRTRILNAAREIFSENGFHSASMKAICKSCAISPDALSPFHLQRSPDSGDYLTGPGEGAGPFPGTD